MSEATPPRGPARDRRGGFLMMDLLLALAVMALIVGLALPFVRAGGQASLDAKAAEIASLLRSSRNAALLSGKPSLVVVDESAGVVRSRHSGSVAVVPRGIVLRLLPTGAAGITFTGDGRSSGGTIALYSGRARAVMRVNPLTAAVDGSDSR